jgi:glucose-1-phosphate thymidylyltransferase
MKGIILAGGKGSRLFPVTKGVSKQLLPVYDKPMVYYPLSVLMQAEIKEILLISTPHDLDQYKRLLGDGSQWGINLSYLKQNKPNGLAEAFIIGESFIKDDSICLALGDNIFHGSSFSKYLKEAINQSTQNQKATIFGVKVKDPQRYGVIKFDKKGNALKIEEKPDFPESDYAVAGLYFYPNSVVEIAKTIEPSKRGELEISSINQIYLNKLKLHVEKLGSGFTWLDTGTHESLLEAGQFIQTIEKRQGTKVACLEEIAFQNGWISKGNIIKNADSLYQTGYGEYLINKVLKSEN